MLRKRQCHLRIEIDYITSVNLIQQQTMGHFPVCIIVVHIVFRTALIKLFFIQKFIAITGIGTTLLTSLVSLIAYAITRNYSLWYVFSLFCFSFISFYLLKLCQQHKGMFGFLGSEQNRTAKKSKKNNDLAYSLKIQMLPQLVYTC